MDRLSDVGDDELLAQWRAGDSAALDVLFRRHADGVFRYAFRRLRNRHDAEEVVSDVFRALVHPGGATTPAPERFHPWLFGIARHRVADQMRAKYRARKTQVPLGDAYWIPDAASVEEALDAEQPGWWITAMLGVLSPREREVVELLLVGFRTKEIAEELNISPSAAYMALSRAMRRLRSRMVELEGPEEGFIDERTPN